MSTRGLIGFYRTNRKGEKELAAAYNHSDSYPSWLGVKTLAQLREATPETIEKTAGRLTRVSQNRHPTPRQLEITRQFVPPIYENARQEPQNRPDWYAALHRAQGDWSAWFSGLPYCLDAGAFIYEGSCEWAYIVNVQTQELEVYAGTTVALQVGRYNHEKLDPDGDGKPCVGALLTQRVPLSLVRKLTPGQDEALMEQASRAARAMRDLWDYPPAMLKNKTLPLDFACLQASTAWFSTQEGWRMRVQVMGSSIRAWLAPQADPVPDEPDEVVELPYAIHVDCSAGSPLDQALREHVQALTKKEHAQDLAGVLDALDVAQALYGASTRYAHVLLWAPLARQMAASFDLGSSLAPLLRLCARLERPLTLSSVEDLRQTLASVGMIPAAWRWLSRHSQQAVAAMVHTSFLPDVVAADNPYFNKNLRQAMQWLNVMCEVMPNESLTPATVALLDDSLDIRRIDLTDGRRTRFAALVARGVHRAHDLGPDHDAAAARIRDLMDYLRQRQEPLPDNSTLASIERLSQAWHFEQAMQELSQSSATWENRMGVRFDAGFMVVELSTAQALAEEGHAMRHCVRSYVAACVQGRSRIFSIRKDGAHVATLEICQTGRGSWKVEQLRGLFNRLVSEPEVLALAKRIAQGYAQAAHALQDSVQGGVQGGAQAA